MSRYNYPSPVSTWPGYNGSYIYGVSDDYIPQPSAPQYYINPLTPAENNYLQQPTLTSSSYSRIVIINGKVQE